jgi:soluble lytic murein transglycosylase-like protein
VKSAIGASFAACRKLKIAAFCGLILVPAYPTASQVIEIFPDGSTVTHSGPQISTLQGAIPVARPVKKPANVTIEPVSAAIRQTAFRYAVSDQLIEAVAWQESRLNQNAVSPKGARGVMQLMPETAQSLGVDPSDLAENIAGGTAYLAQLLERYNGVLMLALAAYNAGPAAVERHNGVPPFPETQDFVASVLERLAVLTPVQWETSQ